MLKSNSVKIIENPKIFEEWDSENQDELLQRILSLKSSPDEDIILIVPTSKKDLFKDSEDHSLILELYFNGIFLLAEEIVSNLKKNLTDEFLKDAIVLKTKLFYKGYIKLLVEKACRDFLKEPLEITGEKKVGIRSLNTVIRLLSQAKLKVEPGWINLIKDKQASKIVSLIVVTLKGKEIPLVVQIEPFSGKPSQNELREILKQFLIKFVELIAARKSSPFISVNTLSRKYLIKDLTQELGKSFVIVTSTGKFIRDLKNLKQFHNEKFKFLFFKGGGR